MRADTFHIHLYGPIQPYGEPIQPYGGPPGEADRSSGPRTSPIPTTFDAATDRMLRSLPMVLLEPDGSFAWAGSDHQIVGMIYDAAMSIQYVEIRGHADADRLRKLVQALVGHGNINELAVMVLPERQWKDFQSFERMLSGGAD